MMGDTRGAWLRLPIIGKRAAPTVNDGVEGKVEVCFGGPFLFHSPPSWGVGTCTGVGKASRTGQACSAALKQNQADLPLSRVCVCFFSLFCVLLFVLLFSLQEK